MVLRVAHGRQSKLSYHATRLMTPLSRRAFLVLTALVTPLGRQRLAAQATSPAISLDEFVRLSQRLVGTANLDRNLATTYLNGLLTVPARAVQLAQMARNAPGAPARPEDTALENIIIEWWYTGAYTLKGEPRLATHTGALMWNALGMNAPGTCAGGFGTWARPPRARA